MKIINTEKVLDFIDSQNKGFKPLFKSQQLQIHIDYNCGCKITQDKKGNSLFPCNNHKAWANNNADNKTLSNVYISLLSSFKVWQ